MTKINTIVKIAVSLAALGVVNQANATWYTIGDGGLEWGWNLNIDGFQHGGGVGGIEIKPTDGLGNTYITVCTDISGNVTLTSKYDFKSIPFKGQYGLNPNWGYKSDTTADPDKAYAAIQNAAYIFDKNKDVLYATGTGSTVYKAALQLAVWEALYDTGNPAGFSFTKPGRFEASGSSAAASIALDMLKALPSTTEYSGNLLQTFIGTEPNIAVQELIGILTPVPEPTTVLAGALLLLPFGVITLGKMRKNRIV
jgi:hypothetical protein